jgi:hypothetical protein
VVDIGTYATTWVERSLILTKIYNMILSQKEQNKGSIDYVASLRLVWAT